MKRILINIFSLCLIIGSVISWKYLYPRLIQQPKADTPKQQIKVEGEHTQREAIDQPKKKNENDSSKLTFDVLYKEEPDAPKKKENSTEMYVRARSAIAIDAETGTILHYQDGKKRMAIASLTKIMTAVLVVENIKDLEHEIVTIDKETLYTEGTVIGCPRTGYCISNRLQSGERISALNLLRATLMNSTNDAATALGKHIGGTKEGFAELMNKKAKELGLSDTHFCNPSGLDEDDKPGACYSSAYDLARIAAYSLQYDTIWEIMKTEDMDICSADGKVTHHIINTDELLDQMPNCLGGKTGFTYEAGKSLMMAAHHPNDKKHQVVAVMLDNPYRWEDMRLLFDWTFTSYEWPQKHKK